MSVSGARPGRTGFKAVASGAWRGSEAAVARAERSLAMAGQALDPNRPGGADLPLGRLLLAHALGSVAQAMETGGPPRSDVAAAIDTLERSGLLARASMRGNGARSVLECLEIEPAQALDAELLVDAEVLLGKLVRVARREPAVARIRRWSRWGFTLLSAAAVLAVMAANIRRVTPSDKYRWTASSGALDYGTSGVLGAHGDFNLVFHTDLQARPWILVDLLEDRSIRSVTVTNRSDCCDKRCLPLFVEVAGDDKHFVEVGRRTEAFAVWRADFSPRRARYVKLWVDATTYFHLEGIEIR